MIAMLVVYFLNTQCNTREVPTFDKERAFSYLVQQVEFGPRVPGSEASVRCRQYFVEHFTSAGMVVDSQNTTFVDPYTGSTVPLVNLIARQQAKPSARSMLIVAHYDCRPRAEHAIDTTLRQQPIDGASDAAAGPAILMELSNMFKESAPDCNVDFLLSDGEDWGMAGDAEWYGLGARHFASQGIRDKYEFAIVLSLVGDKDQQIYRESFSETYAKPLNDLLFTTAKEFQIHSFYDSVKYALQDDQVAINGGGVPAALLIDFDYTWWHTEFDTPAQCSPQSLENVARVVAHVVYNTSQWPDEL